MNDEFKFWMREAFIRGWAASRHRGDITHNMENISERAAASKFENWWETNHA